MSEQCALWHQASTTPEPLLPDGRCRVCLSYGYCYLPDRCPQEMSADD